MKPNSPKRSTIFEWIENARRNTGNGPASIETVLEGLNISTGLAIAVDEFHKGRGIGHGMLTPESVVINNTKGGYKIEFDDKFQSSEGLWRNMFFAPERTRVSAERRIRRISKGPHDVYSMGLLIYCLLTATPPKTVRSDPIIKLQEEDTSSGGSMLFKRFKEIKDVVVKIVKGCRHIDPRKRLKITEILKQLGELKKIVETIRITATKRKVEEVAGNSTKNMDGSVAYLGVEVCDKVEANCHEMIERFKCIKGNVATFKNEILDKQKLEHDEKEKLRKKVKRLETDNQRVCKKLEDEKREKNRARQRCQELETRMSEKDKEVRDVKEECEKGERRLLARIDELMRLLSEKEKEPERVRIKKEEKERKTQSQEEEGEESEKEAEGKGNEEEEQEGNGERKGEGGGESGKEAELDEEESNNEEEEEEGEESEKREKPVMEGKESEREQQKEREESDEKEELVQRDEEESQTREKVEEKGKEEVKGTRMGLPKDEESGKERDESIRKKATTKDLQVNSRKSQRKEESMKKEESRNEVDEEKEKRKDVKKKQTGRDADKKTRQRKKKSKRKRGGNTGKLDRIKNKSSAGGKRKGGKRKRRTKKKSKIDKQKMSREEDEFLRMTLKRAEKERRAKKQEEAGKKKQEDVANTISQKAKKEKEKKILEEFLETLPKEMVELSKKEGVDVESLHLPTQLLPLAKRRIDTEQLLKEFSEESGTGKKGVKSLLTRAFHMAWGVQLPKKGPFTLFDELSSPESSKIINRTEAFMIYEYLDHIGKLKEDIFGCFTHGFLLFYSGPTGPGYCMPGTNKTKGRELLERAGKLGILSNVKAALNQKPENENVIGWVMEMLYIAELNATGILENTEMMEWISWDDVEQYTGFEQYLIGSALVIALGRMQCQQRLEIREKRK